MILINGKQQEQWFIADRAFQYGDGCFTTMLVKCGKINHWQEHLARLKRDTLHLAIQPIDWDKLYADLMSLVATLRDEARMVVKILISRGMGGKGYSPTQCAAPTIIISTHAYPTQYLAWQKKGITLAILSQRIGLSPLAGIKHLNRLEQVLLKRELEQHDADDAVVCCLKGNVVETTSGNIFWRKGKILYTPCLKQAGVLGTQRAVILNAAAQLKWKTKEVITKYETLLSADEIFVCNALMELVPVRKLENVSLYDSSFCEELMLRLS